MLLDRDDVLKRLAPLGDLHAPLSERTVRGYERRFGVELPRDYRHFVTTIGDGGVGPHYGLFRLREMFGGRDQWFGGDPSRPFLHTRAWNLAERERSTRRYWAARWLDGAVPIAHHGCGYLDWLVVTGEQRGTVSARHHSALPHQNSVHSLHRHAQGIRRDECRRDLRFFVMAKHQAIRTKKDYDAALAEIDRLLHYPSGSPEERELETVSILVEAYDREHGNSIPDADPIQVLTFVMEQQGLARVDLEPMIGPRGRVSEVMTYKRPLSLTMMRSLSEKLHIPLGALATEYKIKSGRRARKVAERAASYQPKVSKDKGRTKHGHVSRGQPRRDSR